MRGNNNRKVGEIISKLMKNPKLAKELNKLDALDAWERIIGAPLCKYITDQKIYNGILYVQIKSSVVRNELNYKKSDLIIQINQKIGKKFITDIILK